MRLFTSLIAVALAAPAFAQEAPEPSGTMTRPEAVDEADDAANTAVEAAQGAEEAAEEASQAAARAAEQAATAESTSEGAMVRSATLEERMDGLEEMLLGQRDDITRMRLQLLDTPDLTFDLEGEYRTRGYLYPNLFDGQERDARYMDHWLRLRPVFRYKDLASLHVEFRGLQNVLWGDNISISDTALFASNPSNTTLDGQEQPSIYLNRAWMEFKVPVGIMRVGRQPSAWGLGLLVNNGDGFDDPFGENRGSSTFDRVLFGTKPIAIAQTIMGKDPDDIPLIAAISVDRLVESPRIQYYGYECVPNIPETSDAYDPRCDQNGDGVTEQNHGFTDSTVTTASRDQDWWADQDDDVWELVMALIYNGEDVSYLGGRGDLKVGAYGIHRLQRETNSDVWIVDGYLEADVHNVYVAFEGIGIYGNSEALTLPSAEDDGNSPLYKTVNIGGYVARLGYTMGDFDVRFEHGMASGDDDPSDRRFTGRPLNPDYNVGLILYEEVLSRTTAQRWTEGARGLWSQGGVYNSRYIFPLAHYSPLENWDLYAGGVVAWPHKPDGSIIQCREGDNVECASYNATSGALGWEVDFAIKHRWHEHMLFSIESGYAHVTDRVPLQAVGLNPNGNFFTLQSRIAWEF